MLIECYKERRRYLGIERQEYLEVWFLIETDQPNRFVRLEDHSEDKRILKKRFDLIERGVWTALKDLSQENCKVLLTKQLHHDLTPNSVFCDVAYWCVMEAFAERYLDQPGNMPESRRSR